jgi:hypothetical protein
MIAELILVLNLAFVSLILILQVIILIAHYTILVHMFSCVFVLIIAHHTSIFMLLLNPWSFPESLLVCIRIVWYYFFEFYVVVFCVFWRCLVLESFIVIGSLIIIISIPYKWLKTRLLLKEGMLFYIVLFVLLMMLVVFFIRILVYHLIIVSSIFQRVVLFLKTRSVVKSYVIILLYDPVLVIIKVLVLIGDEIIMIDINTSDFFHIQHWV